jgi:hypothetical protein
MTHNVISWNYSKSDDLKPEIIAVGSEKSCKDFVEEIYTLYNKYIKEYKNIHNQYEINRNKQRNEFITWLKSKIIDSNDYLYNSTVYFDKYQTAEYWHNLELSDHMKKQIQCVLDFLKETNQTLSIVDYNNQVKEFLAKFDKKYHCFVEYGDTDLSVEPTENANENTVSLD